MKILVTYATAGAGHRKAAEAVYHGLRDRPGVDAVLVDALDYTSRFYKNLYSRMYTLLITRVPWLWGFFFALLDARPLLPLYRLARRGQNTLHARALSRYLRQRDFDVIITTHFFPSEVATYLKRRGRIRARIFCVITDFDAHSIWLSDGIDRYMVADAFTRQRLLSLGVDAGQITVTGIPTEARFNAGKDRPALRAALGLRVDRLTVLVATGSFGIGPIEQILDRLGDWQVIVVCGHNQSLFQRLSRRGRGNELICGLVDNMDELMAAADCMLTKPGGLSISEALVVGLPMIFFNAIPGQETNNIRVLAGHGVGTDSQGVDDIVRILAEYRTRPETLLAAKEQTRALAKPDAVRDILQFLSS